MSKRGRGVFILSFLAPAVLIYAAFVVYPLIQAFQLSTYSWRGVSDRKKYTGGANFDRMYHDSAFWQSLLHSLQLFVVGGFVILVLSVAVAHGLHRKGKIAGLLRSVVLFPQMISLVAVAVMWMFVFNPQSGLLTPMLHAAGLDGLVHTWLGDRKTALSSVGVAFIWYAAGFYIMLFAAGLKAIPAELHEAAELDGAAGLQRFWRVTWPMLWSVKRIAVVHLAITVVNIFVLVFLMTRGGPDRATDVMLTYLYEVAFQDSRFGYATAMAAVNFVFIMLVAVAILLAFRRDPAERRTA